MNFNDKLLFVSFPLALSFSRFLLLCLVRFPFLSVAGVRIKDDIFRWDTIRVIWNQKKENATRDDQGSGNCIDAVEKCVSWFILYKIKRSKSKSRSFDMHQMHTINGYWHVSQCTTFYRLNWFHKLNCHTRYFAIFVFTQLVHSNWPYRFKPIANIHLDYFIYAHSIKCKT